MKCEKCKVNDATIHFNKIINGEKYDLFYCESCAKLFDEVDYDTPFSKDKMLSSLMDTIHSSAIKVNYIVMTKCSKCGMTYNSFKNLGLVGCSNCYKTFDKKFDVLIRDMQKGEYHMGKSPMHYKLSKESKIEILKRELKKAIAIEAFEEAIKIRDEIKSLEGE